MKMMMCWLKKKKMGRGRSRNEQEKEWARKGMGKKRNGQRGGMGKKKEWAKRRDGKRSKELEKVSLTTQCELTLIKGLPIHYIKHYSS